MKHTIRLAFAYIKYYRKQTLTLFLGIVLSAALLTGIGSLFGSGKQAALENARIEYGDWHYTTRCDAPWFAEFEKNPNGKGYQVNKYGVKTIRKSIEEPYHLQLVYTDKKYLEMMGRTFLEGQYPQKENEIAMDAHTLMNLGVPQKLGSEVILDEQTFVLCGILNDLPEKMQEDFMEVYVNNTLDYGTNGSFVYLKFKESRPVYQQMESMTEAFDLTEDQIVRNNGIAGFVGGERPGHVWKIIKTGLSYKEAGFPYIWGNLNEDGSLTEGAILAVIGLFGAFIIYSLFQISVLKRLSQYSVLQILGMTEGVTLGNLLAEMGMIFLAGFPTGCFLGNGIAGLLYQKIGRIFITQNSVPQHSGFAAREQMIEQAASRLPDAGAFHINWQVIWGGAAFLCLILFLISCFLVRRMRNLTHRQMIAKDIGIKPKNRKIYSICHGNMSEVLTKKFMFARKGAFLGILASLSIGSIIFLGAAYVTENTKINNELVFKADDGLGSDIQVYEASDTLRDVIPEENIQKLNQIPELDGVHPVRYQLGEIALKDGMLKWTSYYPEIACEESWQPDPELMEKYNGIAVQTGEDDYTLKVNIYGYDDEMLEQLQDYLLEGEINPDQMRRDNTVIFKTLMGGQGDYDGIAIKPGDTVRIKTVKDTEISQETLKFQGSEEWYQNIEMKVAALVSRPLAKVDTFIGDQDNNVVDLIMTNEQMEKNFGVTGYQTISITLKQGTNASQAGVQIKEAVSDVSKCIVKDYTQQIEAQNFYLAQKMLFFYGIAAVLLGISILHIMNSMQYLVAARKHEFGILRAMGITDSGFRKMLAKEGLRYGIYSSLVMLFVYFIVQKILYYFMMHIYLYLHPKAFISWIPLTVMIVVNIVICITAVLVSGREVLRQQVIEEIRA